VLAQLGRQFAPVANAPTGVMARLARDDDIAISGPVLAQSQRLTDDDLIEIASTKSRDHLLKIAGRARLNEAITEIFVDRGNSEIVNEVAANNGAQFSYSSFSKLVMWSDGDERLAEAIAARPDLPLHLIRQLLVRATERVRERLLSVTPPEARDEVQRVLTEIAGQFNKAVTPRYYSEAKLLVRKYSQDTQLTMRKLLEFANAHRLGESVAALSVLSGLPIDLVDRLIYDPGHYGILVLCKAIGTDWATAQAVMTIPRAGVAPRSLVIEDVYDEYQALSDAAAQRLLRFWRVRQMNPGGDGTQRKDDIIVIQRVNPPPAEGNVRPLRSNPPRFTPQ